MSLSKAFRGASRQRVMRCIAILFLLYTAADLTDPQMCSEEAVSLTTARVSISASGETKPTALSISSDEDSSRRQVPERESQDEDCFCCCAHIVPAIHFVTPETIARSSIAALKTQSLIPQNELETPYHPPRFS